MNVTCLQDLYPPAVNLGILVGGRIKVSQIADDAFYDAPDLHTLYDKLQKHSRMTWMSGSFSACTVGDLIAFLLLVPVEEHPEARQLGFRLFAAVLPKLESMVSKRLCSEPLAGAALRTKTGKLSRIDPKRIADAFNLVHTGKVLDNYVTMLCRTPLYYRAEICCLAGQCRITHGCVLECFNCHPSLPSQ